MAQKSLLEETIRIHDIAFMRWLLGCRIDYGNISGTPRRDEPILALMSSPEHAFAQTVDLLVERNWIAGTDAEEMRANAAKDYSVLPLPIAAIERTDPMVETELANVPMRNRRFDYDPETNMYVGYPHPAFYQVDYTVTLLGLSKYTWAHIWQWVAGQLGLLGRTDRETLIPVEHDMPWGTLNQRLRYNGSTDMNNYEGNEEPRYVRKQVQFDLRMLAMKRPDIDPGADRHLNPPFDRITFDISDHRDQYDTLLECYQASGWQYDQISMNLFHIPDFEDVFGIWPTGGNAQVEPYTLIYPTDETIANSLVVTASEPTTDWAEIGELENYKFDPPNDGYGLFDISFEYIADGDWNLEVYTRDLTDDSLHLTDRISLPQKAASDEAKVHLFSPVDMDSISYRLVPDAGTATETTIKLLNVAIHRISMSQNFAPTNIIDTGIEWRYEWSEIGVKKPCLVLAQITSTSGGEREMTVEDDLSAATYQKSRDIQEGITRWVAFLIQPKVSDLLLRVPKDVTLATIRTVRYHGAYNGHTV